MSIDLTVRDDVAEIALNDPGKLNALEEGGLAALSEAYTQAAEAGVRALILRGEGRAFCAGRDLSIVDTSTDDPFGALETIIIPLFRQISDFPAPTFAVANGACLGIGLGLLVATDVVYVADTARIGSPFANLGGVLDSGGHALFFERLGAHRALDLIYTAELMSGSEAVALGLFSRVVPEAEVLEFTRERAARVARGATGTFLASKKIVQRLRDERIGLWESIADENVAQGEAARTDDYREGFAAFKEKRRPVFTGQ
jgi:2-(1,2-epoxy-1,2-dihydrophenyl)acetyl-CoA isomerase